MNSVKLGVLFIIGVLLFFSCSPEKLGVEEMEYRKDSEAIIERFPNLGNIVECYWKADNIGKTNFGPSSYWMKGFIVLDKDEVDKIDSQYEWTSISLEFVSGVDPNITGFSDFEWKHSQEFSDDTRRTSFVGEFYYDIINGILYFDLESN